MYSSQCEQILSGGINKRSHSKAEATHDSEVLVPSVILKALRFYADSRLYRACSRVRLLKEELVEFAH